MIAKTRVSLLMAGLLALTTAGAAQGADVGNASEPVRTKDWQGTLGVRTTLIRDRGFDPFATTDALPQLSIGVARVLARQGAIALALGLAADVGTTDARARSADSHLRLTRGSVPVELRLLPRPQAYLFARVAPGVLRVDASMTDSAAPATMTGGFTSLSVDASAGLAVRVSPSRSVVGVWIEGDGGYAYAPSHDLAVQPALGGADRNKAGALMLAPLAARGAFGRLGVAIAY